MRSFCVLSVFLMLLPGCSSRPAEFADLKPVVITVTKDGVPLEGVNVALKTEEFQNIWPNVARTDARGIARIDSTCQGRIAAGAVPGTYKVTLDKPVDLPAELRKTPEEEQLLLPPQELDANDKKRNEYVRKHRVLAPEYGATSTTPLEITVTESGPYDFTLDVKGHIP